MFLTGRGAQSSTAVSTTDISPSTVLGTNSPASKNCLVTLQGLSLELNCNNVNNTKYIPRSREVATITTKTATTTTPTNQRLPDLSYSTGTSRPVWRYFVKKRGLLPMPPVQFSFSGNPSVVPSAGTNINADVISGTETGSDNPDPSFPSSMNIPKPIFPFRVRRQKKRRFSEVITATSTSMPNNNIANSANIINMKSTKKPKRKSLFGVRNRFRSHSNLRSSRRYRWFSTNREARLRRRESRRILRWWLISHLSFVGNIYKNIKHRKLLPAVRLTGAASSMAYTKLPLKAMSRVWGRLNSMTLPLCLRAPTIKAYSYLFGVNLDEVDRQDLTTYKNLGEFFCRQLKPNSRPIDENSVLTSPADGTVIHFGQIKNGEIEQVKGLTYSLEALLGPLDFQTTQTTVDRPTNTISSTSSIKLAVPSRDIEFQENEVDEMANQLFAKANGIPHNILHDPVENGSANHLESNTKFTQDGDATISSVPSSSVNKVNEELMSNELKLENQDDKKKLFYTVIYLAPGDYHRFHSPSNWVVQLRRHFVGELFSVAPFFQTHFHDLFILNERVALLGKWKHGFFSMTPVGATNVGSIKLNFDKDLITNNYYEDASIYGNDKGNRRENDRNNADSQTSSETTTTNPSTDSSTINSNNSSSTSLSSLSDSTNVPLINKDNESNKSSFLSFRNRRLYGYRFNNQKKKTVKNTCYEATYGKASRLLGGVAMVKGQEMGGFNLGSTIVLVFEAPKNFEFKVKEGQHVSYGQSLGDV